MSLLYPMLAFILGVAAGSLLNSCFNRSYPEPFDDSSDRSGGHRHDDVGTLWRNFSLLRFVIGKGKCSTCGKPIPFQYPLFELATGLLFLLVFKHFSWSVKTASAFFLVAVLLLITVIDLKSSLIPNKIIFPALAVSFLLLLLDGIFHLGFLPLIGNRGWIFYPLLGAFVGGGFLLLPALINENWMGGGDFKLGAFIGLFVGARILWVLFFGFLSMAIVSTLLIVSGRLGRKDSVPFGPFLALGTIVALFL